jgi:hypothetical protein
MTRNRKEEEEERKEIKGPRKDNRETQYKKIHSQCCFWNTQKAHSSARNGFEPGKIA